MPRPRLFHPQRAAALLASLVGLAACAAAPRVEVDRVAGEDLSRFETFAFVPDLVASDAAFGPSAREAAREALVAELSARGLEPADDPDAADLRVGVGVFDEVRASGGDVWVRPGHAHVHRHRTGVRTPVGDVPLGEERHVVHHPGSVEATPSHETRSRTVVVDVYEGASDRLLWRGTSRDARSARRIDPDELRERVRAIASRFP